MSTDVVAVARLRRLFALMLLRVPVGMAMGLVGVTGFGYLTGFQPALKLVGQTSMRTVTDYTFGVIPMFLLMGAFVSMSGISRELFRAANAFVGHLRGGLGIATVAACGGFAAICGSSVATAATFSTVAYPEMRRFGYPQSFATGVIAAGGTLGAMLPPSTVLAVYGIITQQDIGKLFMAGIIPGLLAIAMYMITIARDRRGAAGLPADRAAQHLARADAGVQGRLGAGAAVRLRDRRALRRRSSRRPKPAASARSAPSSSACARGKLTRDGILQSLLQATRTAAAVFTVLIGALLLRLFPHHHADPAEDHRIPHRPRPRPLRRAGADHVDVSDARLPDGRDGDDHPDRADHLPGDHRARLRSDLVRRHHRDDGGTRPDLIRRSA